MYILYIASKMMKNADLIFPAKTPRENKKKGENFRPVNDSMRDKFCASEFQISRFLISNFEFRIPNSEFRISSFAFCI